MTTAGSPAAVPFLDLVSQHRALEEELVSAFRRAVRSASFVGGPELEAFEREFAAYTGTEAAVGVNSGTDALRFALIAMGLRPGDEVITAPHTFIATSEAVTQAGGTIRFADVSPGSMTLDPAAVEAAVTSRTVGILPVHLYGHPADMQAIQAVADRHGLWVLEDAAQAHGARYRGRPVGSLGALAAFSFYPGKNLGSCGEGGAVTGGAGEHLAIVRQLREHGQRDKYYHITEGYNGRLHAIQAAFLRIKLPHLDRWIEGRRRAAAWYREALSGIGELELPTEADDVRHVYHLYVVRTGQRDGLQAHLRQQGIGTGLHYPVPLHLQEAYATLGLGRGAFPVSEDAAGRGLSLPMFPELTESQVARVASAIRAFFD